MVSVWLDTHPVPERGTALQADESHDVAVVGAGLTGVAVAVLLARAGRRTVLIEARSVGAVATGNTTGKVSLLQGTILSGLRARQGDDVLRAYVAANLHAQAWLLSFLGEHGVAHQQRTAVTYANAEAARPQLEAELDACLTAGLPAEWTEHPGLPFDVAGAIQLPDQAQIHPTRALDALLTEFLALGGTVHTGCRVLDIDVRDGCRLTTSLGDVRVQQVVLATGVPILDRGGHFARLQAQRSYALAFRVPGDLPQDMYLSVDDPSRSLRTAPVADGELLIVGGNGHPVGRAESPLGLVDDLIDWTTRRFPGATPTHRWSAQDYAPTAAMPLVGALPWSEGRVFAATGYHKWGMTNAVAAALRLAGAITGDRPAWAAALDSARGVGVLAAAKLAAEVSGSATAGWFTSEFRALPQRPPGEGHGVVGRLDGRPAARSTVDGDTRTVSAVCTHLGGVLTWNDAECSWDCPLHGSRFDATGRVLEGPATTDLAEL